MTTPTQTPTFRPEIATLFDCPACGGQYEAEVEFEHDRYEGPSPAYVRVAACEDCGHAVVEPGRPVAYTLLGEDAARDVLVLELLAEGASTDAAANAIRRLAADLGRAAR